MSDSFGIPEIDTRPAFEQINDLRHQLAAAQEEIKRLNEPVVLSEWQQLEQQLAEVTEQRDLAEAAMAATIARCNDAVDQLSLREVQIVGLRDGLESAKEALWDYGVNKHAEKAEKALADTDDLTGFDLCEKEPVAWARYPKYTGAWQTDPMVVFKKPEGNDWIELRAARRPE